jgi:hypothetical protein
VPDARVILNVAFNMRDSEMSDFIDTSRGGLFLLLKGRIPPTDAEFAKDRPQFEAQILANKREMVMNEWASQLYRIANPPPLTRPQQQQSPAGQQIPQRQPVPPS